MLKLEFLEKTTKKREKIIKYYNNHLKEYVRVPYFDKNSKDAFFSYTILVDENKRDILYTYLLKQNIEVKINHRSMHTEKAYANKDQYLVNSIKLSKMKLSLPCHEKLKMDEVKFVVEQIRRFFNEM
jgi:dTDP-4-amino-4,6-dideoxygalactose transaminase